MKITGVIFQLNIRPLWEQPGLFSSQTSDHHENNWDHSPTKPQTIMKTTGIILQPNLRPSWEQPGLFSSQTSDQRTLTVGKFVSVLRISHKDHAANEEVRAKIQQAIGPHEDLLTMVKRRKLQWYGHVSRSSGLAKTILQGKVKGGRRQGRQRKRWEDDIREWTRLEFAKVPEGSGGEKKYGGNWLRNHLWCPNDPRG